MTGALVTGDTREIGSEDKASSHQGGWVNETIFCLWLNIFFCISIYCICICVFILICVFLPNEGGGHREGGGEVSAAIFCLYRHFRWHFHPLHESRRLYRDILIDSQQLTNFLIRFVTMHIFVRKSTQEANHIFYSFSKSKKSIFQIGSNKGISSHTN